MPKWLRLLLLVVGTPIALLIGITTLGFACIALKQSWTMMLAGEILGFMPFLTFIILLVVATAAIGGWGYAVRQIVK